MKFHHILPGAFILAGLSSCAVDPNAYGPAPGPAPVMSDPRPETPIAQAGQIAACGHPGAAQATLRYPDGWQARLAKAPSARSSGGDELLGGVPEPDAVAAPDAEPLAPPQPVYPAGAEAAGQEGRCEILMNVDTSGLPQNILTACSAPQFNAPTYQAATRLQFAPPREGGRSVRLVNVVYPVTYCLNP
ncbi:TonB family protein [Henriciella marina]|uniref:TonB family protein n=1 Tax=Henriciella marina TaxID=453851 RepID=UPI0003A2D776|nr:TonB family protein [Henriciella marina]